MSIHPCISVLMPVYNTENYVGDCIRSILGQTFSDFEFIIIDDSSTDRSPEIIRTFKDKRIRFLYNRERSIPVARNKGLNVVKGKYICIMDADDISLPHRFERQVSFMEKHPEFGLAGSGYRILGRDQDLFREADYEKIKVHLIRNNNFIHPSVIIRHDLLKKNNLSYNIKFCYSSDYDLIARAARYFPVTNMQEVLLHYRVHKEQVTMNYRAKQSDLADEISIDQLRNIGILPDKEERKIHLDLLKGYSIEYSGKKKLNNWIIKLFKGNQRSGFYDKKEMESFVSALLSKQSFINNKEDHPGCIPHRICKKVDLNDVTFVFPVRIESQYRIHNLRAILKYITDNFDTNIVILESDTKRHFFDSKLYDKVSYRFVRDTDEVFQRTNLRNRMISEAPSLFVAVFDSDSISPVDQIVESVNVLRKGDVVMSIPFDGRYFLCNDFLSDLFIRTQNTDVLIKGQDNLQLMFGYHCVGGAYIVNRSEFLKAGGENENIRGWGCDDTERVKNLEVKDVRVHYATGPLFHLWHPRGKNNHFADQEVKKNNIIELLKTCKKLV